MTHRADVVLMRVGDEQRLDAVLVLFQPGDIGQDQIDTGRCAHVRKGHAHVDNNQALLARLAVAINIAVHADLAGTTQRQINQPVLAHVTASSFLLCL